MNPIWISLSTYGGVTTKEALSVLWRAGIRRVELAIGVKPARDTVEALQSYQQQGMAYRAHHAFVWEGQRAFNLAQSFDNSYFKRLTDWLVKMGITAYSVHAGSYPPTADRAAAFARFFENLSQLLLLCQVRGIRLGVETMYPVLTSEGKQYFLQNSEEIGELLQALPDLELVVDLAHLNLWRDTPLTTKLHLLERYRHRLLEVHLSDNDGYRDTHTLMNEHTWWLPHVAALPFDVPVVLESRMNHKDAGQIRNHYQSLEAVLRRGCV